jgi:hypothetical protein
MPEPSGPRQCVEHGDGSKRLKRNQGWTPTAFEFEPGVSKWEASDDRGHFMGVVHSTNHDPVAFQFHRNRTLEQSDGYH